MRVSCLYLTFNLQTLPYDLFLRPVCHSSFSFIVREREGERERGRERERKLEEKDRQREESWTNPRDLFLVISGAVSWSSSEVRD